MILINLSFFASLQEIFEEKLNISVKEPIRLVELFDLFFTKSNEIGSSFFLKNDELISEYIILLNGRNINYFKGLKTIISENSEVSFFPLVGGGTLCF